MEISKVGIAARDAEIKGAHFLADAIKSTIGPFGLNADIQNGEKDTNDGYLISKALAPTLKDEFERRGALRLHKISSITNDEVGDATSTSEVIGDAILTELVKYLPKENIYKAKKSPAELKEMLFKSRDTVFEQLDIQMTPVTSKESLINSALVSVEDQELAEMIGGTQWELGEDGIILAEEHNETFSTIERMKGIKIDNGLGTAIVMNNLEKQSLELKDVQVILTNHTLSSLEPLSNVFDQLVKSKKTNVVIIARAFSSECIKICLENHKTNFFLYPINAPYTNQREVMNDLAAVLGATYFDVEEKSLEDMQLSDVGYASKVIARRYDAIIAGQDDAETEIRTNARINKLQQELQGETSEFAKKALEARIAQLMNGVALLKVGAISPTERTRIKDKVDDAVMATRLALKGGTVPGAGIAFKTIADALPDGDLLKKPLTVIYDQIISSAPEDFIVPEWVRDPILVLKSALKNACQGALTLAKTNIVITTKDKKEKKEDEE